jgi:hypothetical protein
MRDALQSSDLDTFDHASQELSKGEAAIQGTRAAVIQHGQATGHRIAVVRQ